MGLISSVCVVRLPVASHVICLLGVKVTGQAEPHTEGLGSVGKGWGQLQGTWR